MIVATQSFLAGPADEQPPLYHARIGYENRVRDLLATAVVVSSESATGPKDAPTRPNTDEYWEPLALPATWQADMGDVYAVDYVGIAAHNFGTKRTAAKVEFALDAGFTTGVVQHALEVMPDDDTPMVFLGDEVEARHVRITLTGTVAPRMAVVYVGKMLAMDKAVSGPYKPINLSRKSELSARLSRGGQFLGQNFRAHGVEGSVAFRNVGSAWMRANFDPFAKHARSLPYFFAWNPLEFPRDVGYVWTPDADIVPVYNGTGDLMDVDWNMQGIGST